MHVRSSAQPCPTLNSWTVACSDPLSVGFPRQGFWNGLPFPSPKNTPYGKKVKVAQLCLTLSDLMDHTVHGIRQARILEWVALRISTCFIFHFCNVVLNFSLGQRFSNKVNGPIISQ